MAPLRWVVQSENFFAKNGSFCPSFAALLHEECWKKPAGAWCSDRSFALPGFGFPPACAQPFQVLKYTSSSLNGSALPCLATTCLPLGLAIWSKRSPSSLLPDCRGGRGRPGGFWRRSIRRGAGFYIPVFLSSNAFFPEKSRASGCPVALRPASDGFL